TATRNLPAEFIQSIQVIDDYGDMANNTGIKDSEPEKILNIVLKEDKKRILFGQVTGGVGTSDRYIGSFGVNNFNDGQEFSILGSLNNTNTSLFSYGAPTGAGVRERGNADLTGMMDTEDGLNTTNSVGVSYSDDVSDKVSVYGKYTFTNRKNRTLGNSVETSNLGAFSIITQRDKEINTDNRNHLMAWDIETQLDDHNYLKISPNIAFSDVASRHVSNDTIRRGAGQTITNQDYLAEENLSTPNFEMNMQGKYTQRDKLEDINDVSRSINSLTGEPVRAQANDNLQQEVKSNNQNRVGRLKASYVEPIDDNSIVEISYEYNYTAIDSKR